MSVSTGSALPEIWLSVHAVLTGYVPDCYILRVRRMQNCVAKLRWPIDGQPRTFPAACNCSYA